MNTPSTRSRLREDEHQYYQHATGFRAALLDHLSSLPFHAFELVIRDLLIAMGYQDVTLLGRLAWRGRRPRPGAELTAASQIGLSRSAILVQVKQYRRPVARSFVEQLRGTILSTGARDGLLISTSRFSPAARLAAAGEPGAALVPIRLLDGDELLSLLCFHRIGVWTEAVPATGSFPWGIDLDYFAKVTRAASVSRHERTSRASRSCTIPVLEQQPAGKEVG